MFIARSKRSWVVTSSTTSTASAASGRFIFRRKNNIAPRPKISACFMCATTWDRASHCPPSPKSSTAKGYSSGQAMQALEQVFHETQPSEMGFDYFGMSFQEKKAAEGVSSLLIFGLSVLCVFLILAAQYESWSLPFS